MPTQVTLAYNNFLNVHLIVGSNILKLFLFKDDVIYTREKIYFVLRCGGCRYKYFLVSMPWEYKRRQRIKNKYSMIFCCRITHRVWFRDIEWKITTYNFILFNVVCQYFHFSHVNVQVSLHRLCALPCISSLIGRNAADLNHFYSDM